MGYKFIDEVDVKGKTILFHAMMDLPVVKGKIDTSSLRFLADLNDLEALSQRGAKLVVFTWQSRPGKKDFIHLDQHATETGTRLGKEIKQFNWGQNFAPAINEMNDGDILFLDNARMHPEQNFNGPEKQPEDFEDTGFVKSLAPLCDYFCNNALSQSHRGECSIIGFTTVLPSFVGPSLKKEIEGLDLVQARGKPRVLLLGGIKNEDSVELVHSYLANNKVDEVLAGGLLGSLFLKAGGTDFGYTDEWIAERPFLEFTNLVTKAKKVLDEFCGKIFLPIDLAVDANGLRKSVSVGEFPSPHMVKDIGDKTIQLFASKLAAAKTIIWNGPVGIYEEPNFIKGTKELVAAMVKGKAYTVVGGGNTEVAVSLSGFNGKSFSHLSLAGKASLQYLSGKPLVGLTALNKE